MRLVSMLLAVAAAIAPQPWAAAQTVNFESLLGEMTNLDRLADMPSPHYTCKQFSSYDRRSTDPAAATDENWFANHDAGQFLRVDGEGDAQEHVLMDVAGPGAIVRFWSPNPDGAGEIRIYLDGAADPTLAMPLEDMLEAGHPLFPAPISGSRARGSNSFLPIPYAKHCKVTATQPGFYYQINYRTYPEGTQVESFSLEEAKAKADDIAATAKALAAPAGAPAIPTEAEETAYEFVVAAGARFQSDAFQGEQALYRMELEVSAEELAEALRTCVLEIRFDGQTPSVWTPLGDFFGTAPGANEYAALPCGYQDGVFYSNWVMPFRKDMQLGIRNHGNQRVTGKLRLYTAPRDFGENTRYFHARWRSEHTIATHPRQDWNFITAEGSGRYVGNMLHITNPVGAWWGEGDEKIYVDGEDFPSTFGTGTEDYYGYGWCDTTLFSHAYHNQTRCDGPANMGHTSVNRFHVVDDIPFEESFRLDIEVWHWVETTVDQSTVVYWYANAGATDNFPAIDAKELVIPDFPEPPKVEGALEGEDFRVISSTGGHASVQPHTIYGWSNHAHLWWIDAPVGAVLKLGFPVEEAGRYQIKAKFTTAPDYGKHAIAINGKALEEPLDFYLDKPFGQVELVEVDLGVFSLDEGENVFEVTTLEPNEKAEPRRMFGLDYVILEPVTEEAASDSE